MSKNLRLFVPLVGLEPTHLSILAPKASASTDSAKEAFVLVLGAGLEPARNIHWCLRPTRLPVSPPKQNLIQ